MATEVMPPSAAEVARNRFKRWRWVQLVLGVLCMVMIANLQYGWTLFVTPMADQFHWSRAAIQWGFTIFIATETWLVPVEGFLVDRFGPRVVTIGGALLVAAGWSINSVAESLPMLYLGQAIGGIGAGAVYGTCVGNALKWFPDRRGLAAGITAAGYGAGSALTVVPIASMIESSGFQATFLYFGIAQGIVVLVLGLFLAAPDGNIVTTLAQPAKAAQTVSTARVYTPIEMLKTPAFWLMYVMFVMMAAGGLFVTSNLKQIAEDFHVAGVKVNLLGIVQPAAILALSLDRVLNGITRPLFGWISDRIGRENTMFLAFAGEAVGILFLSRLGHDPVLFVLLSGVVFFAWGEIYSLFPSTSADTFGWKHAAANAGALYTAKGTASFFVPIATAIATAAGWNTVFLVSAAMNLAAAILAILVLKPMRKRMLEQP